MPFAFYHYVLLVDVIKIRHSLFAAAERAQVEQFFKDSTLSDRPVVCDVKSMYWQFCGQKIRFVYQLNF